MPYSFSFDLSRTPMSFFIEVSRVASENRLQRRVGMKTRRLAHELTESTGLEVPATLQLVEDLVNVYATNFSERKRFEGTRNRALFLPHCARKYMDSRCKAVFDPAIPSYICGHCTKDCLINVATGLAERKGYVVYVLPGGSCILSILKREKFEGIVGVACGQEVRMGAQSLKRMGFAGQSVPLIRNGCTNTSFDLKSLEKTL